MKNVQKLEAEAEAIKIGIATEGEKMRLAELNTSIALQRERREGILSSIDTMSKEEVERRLNEIKRLYGGTPQAILDVEAKTVNESVEKEKEPPFDTGMDIEDHDDA